MITLEGQPIRGQYPGHVIPLSQSEAGGSDHSKHETQTPIIMDPKLYERVLNESREEVNQTKSIELDKPNACQ